MRAAMVSVCSTLVVILAFTPTVRADVIDASHLVSSLGAGFRPEHPQAWGQTFTAPQGSAMLTRFDLWMGLNTNSGFPESLLPFNVRAYVQRWQEIDPNFGAPTGALLAISRPVRVDVMSTTQPSSLERLSFTLNAPVTPGERYVTFVSAFGFTDPETRAGLGLGRLGLSFSPTVGIDYAGGHLVTGEIIGASAIQSNWCRGAGCNHDKLDIAFIANFTGEASPVPEPSGVLLFATGAMLTMWRRKLTGG